MSAMSREILNFLTLLLYAGSATAMFQFESIEGAFGLLLCAQIVEFFHRYLSEH